MSLSHPVPDRQYNLALFLSKDVDSPQLLEDLLGAKAPTIKHLFTNGANDLVAAFALTHGIPFTVYPISGGRGLPASTRSVLSAADTALLISTPDSKGAGQIAEMCREREAEAEAFSWREIVHEPSTHWRTKVYQIKEILYAMSKDDIKANEWLKAVERVLR